MTRAYGYIYTIFGLEASHASFRASPSIKLARARWAGPNPRLANEDHWAYCEMYVALATMMRRFEMRLDGTKAEDLC
jgi:hypothetical protein